jgi:hypothetical protein
MEQNDAKKYYFHYDFSFKKVLLSLRFSKKKKINDQNIWKLL